MVKIALQFKAFLENVTGLLADGEDFRYDNNSLSLLTLRNFLLILVTLKMVSEAEVRQLRRDSGQVAICGPDGEAASEGRPGGGLCGHQVQGWNNRMEETFK